MDILKSKNQGNAAYVNIGFMILLTLLTQLANLVKTSVAASNFGASVEMDAFNLSNSIGVFVFSFIGTGITTVLIPAMINGEGKKTINNFLSVLYVLSILSVVAIFFFREGIVSIFSSGSTAFLNITSNVMLITLLTQLSNTFLGVTNSYYQVIGKFNIPKVITLITTIMMVAFIVIPSSLTIYEYAFLIFAATFLNVILQFYIAYKKGYSYTPFIDLKDEGLKKMMRIFLPTVFSTGLYQFTLLTDTFISSSLGEGQISILSYSNTIMSMINMLLVGNLMTYIYPNITKNVNEKNGIKLLFNYATFFNFVMCLVVAGFVIVGREGISLLYQRGEFTEITAQTVYYCSIIYAVGLPLNVSRDVIYRYFYAKGNTKATFFNSISASVVNIIVSLALSRIWGIYGVIAGTVITSGFSLTSIIIRLRKIYGTISNSLFVVNENLKLFVSTVLTIFLSLQIKQYIMIDNNILAIVVYGVIAVVLYGAILFVLKSKILKIKL